MLQLIKRCPEYTLGYKEYCQELYDNNIIYFRPTNTNSIDEDWFARTKSWYDKKEKGLIEGQPISFHYWAVDDGKFIGEFQLRTEFPEKVMLDIGSIGYAVSISDLQMSYITNVEAGHGLIKVGSSLVPFANKFPKNTKLYKLMTTKPGESA